MVERIILQTAAPLDHAYRQSGTLTSWSDNVARYAAGNSRLVLAISAAFAGPLLHPTGSESGGFHFRGASSSGKTTALIVGGSAWGGGGVRGYVRTWRATANGLESVAALHCDTLLCLDEMGQVDGREVGQIAYMLSNGQGKTRAGRGGEGRTPAEWRVMFLSSGEIGLSDKMSEDGRGQRAAAGQQVRVVDILADAGTGLGLFETLHGFPDADAFARHLKAAANEHYGVAAPDFVQFIVNDYNGCAETALSYQREFVAEHCPAGADGQVSRVAARFGLVAAAGEMATAFGVVPWQPGEATASALRCYRAWLDVRGGIEPTEEKHGIAAVRRFIELHGSSRFEAMGGLVRTDNAGAPIEARVPNRAGFRRQDGNGGIEYLILPEVWRTEVCAGLDAVAVAKTLNKHGLLIGKDGKLQDQARLPGFSKPVRHYHLTAGILSDGADDA